MYPTRAEAEARSAVLNEHVRLERKSLGLAETPPAAPDGRPRAFSDEEWLKIRAAQDAAEPPSVGTPTPQPIVRRTPTRPLDEIRNDTALRSRIAPKLPNDKWQRAVSYVQKQLEGREIEDVIAGLDERAKMGAGRDFFFEAARDILREHFGAAPTGPGVTDLPKAEGVTRESLAGKIPEGWKLRQFEQYSDIPIVIKSRKGEVFESFNIPKDRLNKRVWGGQVEYVTGRRPRGSKTWELTAIQLNTGAQLHKAEITKFLERNRIRLEDAENLVVAKYDVKDAVEPVTPAQEVRKTIARVRETLDGPPSGIKGGVAPAVPGVAYTIPPGVIDTPPPFASVDFTQGTFTRLSRRGFEDMLFGREPGSGSVQKADKLPAKGDVYVSMSEAGAVQHAWAYGGKKAGWEPVGNLRSRIYAQKIQQGYVIDSAELRKHPELAGAVQEAAARRQLRTIVDTDPDAFGGPLDVPPAPRAVEAFRAGLLGAIPEGEFAALDRAGDFHPYYRGPNRTEDLRAYDVDDLGNVLDPRGMILGDQVEVTNVDGKSYRARYAVVPRKRIITSHLITQAENPLYPQRMQPREQDAPMVWSVIEERSTPAKFNPRMLTNGASRSDDGPIVTDLALRAMNGNGRHQILEMVTENKRRHVYYAQMVKDAASKGFDINAIHRMAADGLEPELIRVVEEPWTKWGEIFSAVDDFTRQAAAGFRAAERAKLDQRAFGEFLRNIEWGNANTIEQWVLQPENSTRLAKIIQKVDGANSFIESRKSERTGLATLHLTEQGRDRIVNAALANVITDLGVMERLQNRGGFAASIFRAYRPLEIMSSAAESKLVSKAYDLTDGIHAALQLMSEKDRTNFSTFRQVLEHGEMIHHLRARITPRERILAELFLTLKDSGAQMADALSYMAKEVPLANSTDLFGNRPQARPPELVAAEWLDANVPMDQRAIGIHFFSDADDIGYGEYGNKSWADAMREGSEDPTPAQSGPAEPADPAEAIAGMNTLDAVDESRDNVLSSPHPDDTMNDVLGTPAGKAEVDAAQKAVDETIKNPFEANPEVRAEDELNNNQFHMPGENATTIAREEGGPKSISEQSIDRVANGTEGSAEDIAKAARERDELAKGNDPPPTETGDGDPPVQMGVGGALTKAFSQESMSKYASLRLNNPIGYLRKSQWYGQTEAFKRPVKAFQRAFELDHDFLSGVNGSLKNAFRLEGRNSIGRQRYVKASTPESAYMARYLDLVPRKFEVAERKLRRIEERMHKKEAAVNLLESLRDQMDFSEWEAGLEEGMADLARLEYGHENAQAYLDFLHDQAGIMQQFEKDRPMLASDLRVGADKADRLMELGERLFTFDADGLSRMNTGKIARGRPLSSRMQAVLRMHSGKFKVGNRVHLPVDFLRDLPDGDMHRPFMLARDGVVGYDYDLVTSVRAFFPLASKAAFIDPVLEFYRPSFREAVGEEAAKVRIGVKGARAASGKDVEMNPALQGMQAIEYEYFRHWRNHLDGVPISSHDAWMASIINIRGRAERVAKDVSRNSVLRRTNAALVADIDRLLIRPDDPRSIATYAAAQLNRAFISGFLGLNPGFYLKNSLQNVSLLAEKGPAAFAIGLLNFSPISTRGRRGMRLAQEWNVTRDFTNFLKSEPRAAQLLAEVGGSDKTALQVFGEAMEWFQGFVMKPAQLSEFLNRGLAMQVGMSHELMRLGFGTLSEAAQQDKAHEIIMAGLATSKRHHFIHGPIGSSPFVEQSPGLKSASLFTDFIQNESELVGSWIYSKENRNMWAMFDFIAWTGYMNAIAERSGWDTTDWLGATGLVRPMAIAGVPGMANPVFKGIAGAWTMIQSWVPGNEISPQIKKEAERDFFQGFIMALIPGYLEGKRVIDTVKRSTRGERRNAKDTEVLDSFRGTLGEYFEGLTGLRRQRTSDRYDAQSAARRGQLIRSDILAENNEYLVDRAIAQSDTTKTPEEQEQARVELAKRADKMVQEGITPKSIHASIMAGILGRNKDVPRWLQKILKTQAPILPNGQVNPGLEEGFVWLARNADREEDRQWAAGLLQQLRATAETVQQRQPASP